MAAPTPAARIGNSARDRLLTLAAACTLVSVGALIYVNGLSAPFLPDDGPSIVENAFIRQLWPLSQLMHAPENTIATARPLVSLSLALNYAIGGLDVRGFRLTNIAIHLIAAVVLFGVVRRTLLVGVLRDRFGPASSGLAFAGALLWVTHPLQTESVNYISQRTESLMGLFYLLTLYCAIRAATAMGRAAHGWSLAAVLACAAGMASKQVMVTAPVMVALWDWAFLAEPFKVTVARRWRLYAGLAATWLLMGALMWTFRDTNVGAGPTSWNYALSQCVVIAQYLRRAIWPTGLLFDYGLAGQIPVAAVVPYAALLAVLLGATAFALVRWRTVGFLAAWVFIILAPTSSVVPLATEVGAERRMYLPLAGLVMMAVMAVFVLAERISHKRPPARGGAVAVAGLTRPGWVAAMLLLPVAGVFCWLTIQRNDQYRDPVALWTSVVVQQPTNYRAHNNLGIALDEAGRGAEAAEEYRRALEANAGFAPAHHNLGKSLHVAGRFEEALSHYRAALEVSASPTLHTDLGAALEAVGRLDEAADNYRAALQIAPDYADAHLNLGRAYFARQEPAEAIRHYQEALRLQPGDVRAHTVLGTALASLGRLDEAVGHYRQALDIAPDFEPAQQNFGSALVAQGKGAEAIEYFRSLVERSPSSVSTRRLLAHSLAAQGRMDEAIAAQRAILDMAGSDAAGMAEARRDLGDLFLAQQSPGEAIEQYQQALVDRDDDATIHFGLGVALGVTGQDEGALRHMEDAVRLAPAWPAALSQLAWLLSGAGGPDVADPARAVELAERAADLTAGQDPAVLQALAAAYRAAGQPDRAAAAAQAAADVPAISSFPQ